MTLTMQSVVGPQKRRILTIIVANAIEQPQWMLIPGASSVVELMEALMLPPMRGEAGPLPWSPRDFLLLDWSGHRMPPDVRVAEVPMPGIVMAIAPGQWKSMADDSGVWMFRQRLMHGEKHRDILFRFLSSPDAARVPANMRSIDAFVSYAFEDGVLASTIVRELKSRGLEVFLAPSSLSTGRQWRDQLREAVRSTRSAALLVTPASMRSPWVMAEAGAFAAQGTPMFVLYDGVSTADIPSPLRRATAIEPARMPERWLHHFTASAAPSGTAV